MSSPMMTTMLGFALVVACACALVTSPASKKLEMASAPSVSFLTFAPKSIRLSFTNVRVVLPLLFRANYARYAAEAKLKNIQRAAEKLVEERLAAEKSAAQNEAAQQAQPESLFKKPPTPTGDSELPKEAINTA